MNTTQNTENTGYADREAWLIEATNVLSMLILTPNGIHLDQSLTRLSCGFPPGKRGGSKHVAIGCCFPRSRSTDGVNEVFISPLIDDVAVILPTLIHELIHAVDDCRSGHGQAFGKMARAVGLVGPLTATSASPQLAQQLIEIADALGPYPHSRITRDNPNKQGTRLLKLQCGSPLCGAIWRMSAKWVVLVECCPCCGDTRVIHGSESCEYPSAAALVAFNDALNAGNVVVALNDALNVRRPSPLDARLRDRIDNASIYAQQSVLLALTTRLKPRNYRHAVSLIARLESAAEDLLTLLETNAP